MNIEPFRNLHAGQTGLLVGNGETLKFTPPEWFDYPSFGMNTIHLYPGAWLPTYYVTVDRRVMNEFGEGVMSKYMSIPKFIPDPKLKHWRGPNFYRFPQRPGALYNRREGKIWQDANAIGRIGMTYVNVMHVAIKLAYMMGFSTILIIGMEHRPHNAQQHFWGTDTGMGPDANLVEIFDGYKQLTAGLKARGVSLINISEGTYVPDDIIPRGDWREWRNRE